MSRPQAILVGLLLTIVVAVLFWVPAGILRHRVLRRALSRPAAIGVAAAIFFLELLACAALLDHGSLAPHMAAFFNYATLHKSSAQPTEESA